MASSANISARATACDPKLSVVTPQHRAALWRYLRVLGASPCDAEDLVQEAFLVALRRSEFDDTSAAAIATLPLIDFEFSGSLTQPLMLSTGRQRPVR